ncbi:MAG TPA: hypothetical protein VHP11_14045 [Tepidisphaeraceae bacterium]|nr:hypothetical protein [Tepidisphaeraceae bacterium]
MNNLLSSTAAPADRRTYRRWSLAARIAAYGLLSALALASVWFINRRVDALANDPPARVAE